MFYTEQGKEKEREAYGDRDAGKQLRVCFALQGFTSGLVCKEGGRQCCKLCQSQIILPFLSNADILKKKNNKKNKSQMLAQLLLAEELLILEYQVENLQVTMRR